MPRKKSEKAPKLSVRKSKKLKKEVKDQAEKDFNVNPHNKTLVFADETVPSELLPNLYSFPPKNLPVDQVNFDRETFHDVIEQAQFEQFIRPLYRVYAGDLKNMKLFNTLHWGDHIKTEILGQTKEFFRYKTGNMPKCINIGQFEITMILANVIAQQSLYCSHHKIAKKIGCNVQTVRNFQRKFFDIYGKMFPKAVKDFIEQYYNKCQALIEAFMPLALINKDPIAAKIAMEAMDKQYKAVTEHSSKEDTAKYEESLKNTRERIAELMKIEQIEDKTND